MTSVDTFFYGLFMDPDLLGAQGVTPTHVARGSVDGLALRIGRRATLVSARGERVHGMVMKVTRADLRRLYADPSLRDYVAQTVTVTLLDGRVLEAVCYVLRDPPDPSERDPDYAARLRAAAQKMGLPEDYVRTIATLNSDSRRAQKTSSSAR